MSAEEKKYEVNATINASLRSLILNRTIAAIETRNADRKAGINILKVRNLNTNAETTLTIAALK
jgi:hypothetical protein